MVAKFNRTRTMNQTKAKQGGGNDKAPRIDELVTVFKPKPDKWYTIRLLGPNFSYGQHWFEVEKQAGGTAKFSKQCLRWNDEKETVDTTIDCPYCEISARGKPGTEYYQNAIIREIQDRMPDDLGVTKAEAKTGFKDKDSDSVTPVNVMRFPAGAVENLRNIGDLNKHGKKGAKEVYDLSDPEFGCDIMYMFCPKATGTDKHKFQKGDHTPLEDNELEYLLWNIEDIITPDSLERAESEAESLVERLVLEDGQEAPSYKKSGSKGGKKKADDDGDDDDAPPKKGGKKPAADDGDDDGDDLPAVGDKVSIEFENDDGDDETVIGEVTKVNAKKITIEDKGGDDHTFAIKDVKISAAKKPAASGKKPAKDEDDDAPAGKKGGKKPAASDDDDGDDYTPAVGDKIKATDEDDDSVTGVVIKVNDKSVTIEDDDEENHTLKLADVTIKLVKAGKKKPAKDEDDDGEEDPKPKGGKKPAKDDDGDGDEPSFAKGDKVTVTDSDDEDVTGVITKISDTSITIEDEDEDDHTFKLAKVKVKAAGKKKKPAKEDDDDAPAPKKGGKKADADDEDEPKPKNGKKPRPSFDDDD